LLPTHALLLQAQLMAGMAAGAGGPGGNPLAPLLAMMQVGGAGPLLPRPA